MVTALVIVHPGDIGVFAEEDPKGAEKLSRSLTEAIESHVGPVFMIEKEPWWAKMTEDLLDPIEDAFLEKAAGWQVDFDDVTDDWDEFLPDLASDLKGLGVTEVKIGGLWYSDQASGCATTVASYLRDGFKVKVDRNLVACVDLSS
jgi:hypothetical protein